MESSLSKVLSEKSYEKRKVAALDVEKLVRENLVSKDSAKISSIINSLCDLAHSTNANARSGGLMGLAGVSIALGIANIPKHLTSIVPSVLRAFADTDSKVRYYACESMYNIGKVAKGEVLIYFNEIFDALSKLCADPEIPVKNGAELLDRLVKDIVSDQAANYVFNNRSTSGITTGLGISDPVQVSGEAHPITQMPTAEEPFFSLARFIPLLKERINVVNPESRMFLVTWLTVLDSVPELELISYLPDFLEGLIWFLDDPTDEIRLATRTCLAELLKETHDIADAQMARERARGDRRLRRASRADSFSRSSHKDVPSRSDARPREGSPLTLIESTSSPTSMSVLEADEQSPIMQHSSSPGAEVHDEEDGLGTWEPGQGVVVRHAEIVEILIKQMMVGPETEREVQAVCLKWIADFLQFAQPVILSFTPRLLPLVIAALAHHIPQLRQAAHNLNVSLFHVISEIPSVATVNDNRIDERPPTVNGAASTLPSIPSTPVPHPEDPEPDPFDYQATVAALCTLLGVEEEESRLASLHWLAMLHSKQPGKILSLDDGTFPALLKTLSDPSEDVIKSDLQLLAQISSSSAPEYFHSFMVNLVRLFSTDRPLLEHRGKTIIGQLCLSLNTERIFRSFADILEKEEDLEFASLLVQNLNLFLITLPELADFRRRLKNLDTKDGSLLFTSLYRSFSHNAVATLTLCFLAQAYEHASNLLQIFAELEMTVSLLIQLDKLVQLLESTVFTSLRLQLLETERYPYLLKALYGVLMLLPQSTAFVTLRNRLNSVSTFGLMHAVPKTSTTFTNPTTARSSIRKVDDMKWAELLSHFRSLQFRHERARRQAMQQGVSNLYDLDPSPAAVLPHPSTSLMNMVSTKQPIRRPASKIATALPSVPSERKVPPPRSASIASTQQRPQSPTQPSLSQAQKSQRSNSTVQSRKAG